MIWVSAFLPEECHLLELPDPLTLIFAGGAGVLSFFSPCILPMLPAYLGHLAGVTLAELENGENKAQRKVFSHALLFVVGFSAIFIIMGSALGFLGQQLGAFQVWLSRIGGVAIIGFGMYTLRILPSIPLLERQRRLFSVSVGSGYFSSALIGASFGIGWTPCVGSILASIFVLASSSTTILEGAALLSVYSIGLAIPFLFLGLFTSRFSKIIKRINRRLSLVNIISGILLIVLGIVVFTNNFGRLLGLFL
jgi:cytochrome c-type biogenesis protein